MHDTTHGSQPKIIFEDNHLVVLCKPAGLLSQGEKTGDPNLVDWLRERYQRNYVGLVHRLDRNTSGIMVIAKRTKSAQRLTEALQAGKICRTYLAWLHGSLSEEVHWTHCLIKDSDKNQTRVVPPHYPGAKTAILRGKPLAKGLWRGEKLTLVEIELETGRSHQIRAQAAHQKHPVLGDQKYGRQGSSFPRPALHSFRIRFPHPISKEEMSFECPMPNDMAAIQSV